MLSAHIPLLQAACGGHGQLEYMLAAGGKIVRTQAGAAALSHCLSNHIGNFIGCDSLAAEQLAGRSAALAEQSEQQMFAANISMPEFLRSLHGEVNRAIGFFSKSIETIHMLSPPIPSRR